MKIYTSEEVEEMDKKTAISNIMDNVYEACLLLKQLKRVGKIHGNDHQLREKVSHAAKRIIKEQWLNEKNNISM